MRVHKLDLLRYGQFINVPIEFPATNSDIHIIFGSNEAGKSTSLAAIEGLLFGIPYHSPYNFVHDYSIMRVGGVLQHDGKTLEVRRCRENKDTLLGLDETLLPSGDSTLMSFIGGADQTFFTRMFSLNHERLSRGGREILEAKDEVGQTHFAAGTGISGLHDRIETLTKEADTLWAPRRAAHRKYYKALDALEETDKAMREHTITASKWQETMHAYDAAQEACDDLQTMNEALSAEQRKLSCLWRAYRRVWKFVDLSGEIIALGEITRLPGDADEQLEAAKQAESNSQSRIEELIEQLNRAKADRAELDCDETMLLRSADIQQLHKQRIEIQKEKANLPASVFQQGSLRPHSGS